MYIARLELNNFRNYIHQELELPDRVIVFHGNNAQGKTNILEAIYMLATSKSPRISIDRELINWNALNDDLPMARLAAESVKNSETNQIEITLLAQPKGTDILNAGESKYFQKRIRVNGLPYRATDMIGTIRVVLFDPQDNELIGGAPSLRRRYLDITNSQIDPDYLRSLQRYNKVLWQRNHLLRLIRDHRANPEDLSYWDEQLVSSGSYLVSQRKAELVILKRLASEIHQQLTGGAEELDTIYVQSVVQEQETKEAFHRALYAARDEEIVRGLSLIGPHRDDMKFMIGGVDMGVYGSRGQHRTITLSLKLAEARYMLEKTGDSPVLLLDDVLSELDSERRYHLLEAVMNYEQAFITTTDLDHIPSTFLSRTTKFKIAQGSAV